MKNLDYIKIILIGVIAFLLFLLYDLRSHNRLVVDQYRTAFAETKAEVDYFKTKLGETVSEKEAAEISSKQFMELYKREAKELQDDLNIKIKNLKTFVRAEFMATGSGGSSVVNGNPGDEFGLEFEPEAPTLFDKKYLSFSDKYLDFTVDLDSITSDKSYFSKYTYTDTLIYAVSAKKRWLFGNERLYGTGKFSNENAKIIKSTDVLINNYRDKRWAVTVGAYYDPFNARPGLAVGFGYTLFKF